MVCKVRNIHKLKISPKLKNFEVICRVNSGFFEIFVEILKIICCFRVWKPVYGVWATGFPNIVSFFSRSEQWFLNIGNKTVFVS